MKNNFANLIKINENEVLRYLEYKGQDINENLRNTIYKCIEATKEKINPRYILRVYPILREYKNTIRIGNSDTQFKSNHLYKLLEDCDECLIMAVTLGIGIEKEIMRNSYIELSKSIIIDACATTAIEEYCDLIQDNIRKSLLINNKYITNRYSPGYGDLHISANKEIINLLNANKEIGLTITESGIMIPRKSVIAIVGISKIHKKTTEYKCIDCQNYDICKFKKGDKYCGDN